jgi:peptidoglycan/LPS O-acetylase OafA/YrhL
MLGAVTTFLSSHSNTIVRTLGATTILGSIAHFFYADNKGTKNNESSDIRVQRLAIHNAVAAVGAMVTVATLTAGNKMGTKTRVFCVLCSALVVLYPTVMAGSVLHADEIAKKTME